MVSALNPTFGWFRSAGLDLCRPLKLHTPWFEGYLPEVMDGRLDFVELLAEMVRNVTPRLHNRSGRASNRRLSEINNTTLLILLTDDFDDSEDRI
jgi:hypothetical protein